MGPGPKGHSKSGRGIRKWHLYFLYIFTILQLQNTKVRIIPRLIQLFEMTNHPQLFSLVFPSSFTMSNNNPPHNNSDPGSYTFNTALTSEEYIERLTTLGNRRINDILRARSWSLRVNVDGHVINTVYKNNQRSTSSL